MCMYKQKLGAADATRTVAQSVAQTVDRQAAGGVAWIARLPAIGTVKVQRFGDLHRLCAFSPYANEWAVADVWTGFLVHPQVIVTAYHALRFPLEELAIGFGVAHYELDGRGHPRLPHLYRVVQVLASSPAHDVVCLQLDRPVVGGQPLELAAAWPNVALTLLGHPRGLALRTAHGTLVERGPGRIVCNLDAFGGQSGAPVLAKNTRTVVGMLVRGHEDFVTTTTGCRMLTRPLRRHQLCIDFTSLIAVLNQCSPRACPRGDSGLLRAK